MAKKSAPPITERPTETLLSRLAMLKVQIDRLTPHDYHLEPMRVRALKNEKCATTTELIARGELPVRPAKTPPMNEAPQRAYA